MEYLDTILYILLTLAFFVFTVFKGNKKNPPLVEEEEAAQAQSLENFLDDPTGHFETKAADAKKNTGRMAARMQENAEKANAKKGKDNLKQEKAKPYEEQDEEDDDFDLRKAVIHSTILNRKNY